MKPPASTAQSMQGSGIRVIMNAALGMPDALHVEVGEPDFPTPAHIVEAAHAAALSGYTRYTANAGLPSLREALSGKLRRVNGLEVSSERITVTHGGVSGLANVIGALLDPGDELLVPDPGWPNPAMIAHKLGGVPVRYRLDPQTGFLPDVEAISRLVSPRTKAIVVNSPSNPTGAVFPPELIEALVRLAREHDLWLISDEVYEEIVFEGEHTSPALLDTDGRVIGVYSFSKTYAMTGWRVGYVASPPSLTPLINKLQEPTVSCASSVSQKAAEAALLGPQQCVAEMREAYRRRRDSVLSLLRDHGMYTYTPRGAFYCMVDVSRATTDTYAFAKRLLEEQKIAVAPGEAFGPGGAGYVRISLCAADETIERAVAALVREVGAAVA